MTTTTWTLESSLAETKAMNAPIIKRLQQALREAVAGVLPSNGDYAVLDFPNHSNIGDSAIYLGEAILLREHFQRSPKLVTEARDIDLKSIASLATEVPLILHGGGNFGDLYPIHQNFRDAVLKKFPDRKIVIFPQSIHFQDANNIELTSEAINGHPDLTMMVRDHVSLEFARKHYRCKILLVPDMAFMIGAVAPPRKPNSRILALIRQDKESVLANSSSLNNSPHSVENVDWPPEHSARTIFEFIPDILRQFLPSVLHGRRPSTPAAFELLARRRVQRGFEILARGQIVLTDRLHAHILSLLMGIPHIVLDNSYAKIANFSNAWTDGGGFVRSNSFSDAINALENYSAEVEKAQGSI